MQPADRRADVLGIDELARALATASGSVPTYAKLKELEKDAAWGKRLSAGDAVAVDQPLCELETDKVTQVVDASGSGTLLEILVPEGEEAQVGDAICVVEAG